jgi:hypothetical protein
MIQAFRYRPKGAVQMCQDMLILGLWWWRAVGRACRRMRAVAERRAEQWGVVPWRVGPIAEVAGRIERTERHRARAM